MFGRDMVSTGLGMAWRARSHTTLSNPLCNPNQHWGTVISATSTVLRSPNKRQYVHPGHAPMALDSTTHRCLSPGHSKSSQ